MLRELTRPHEPITDFERAMMMECIGDCLIGYTKDGSPIINNSGILMLMSVIHMYKQKYEILTWLIKNNLTGKNLLKFLENEQDDVGIWFHKILQVSKNRVCLNDNLKIH